MLCEMVFVAFFSGFGMYGALFFDVNLTIPDAIFA